MSKHTNKEQITSRDPVYSCFHGNCFTWHKLVVQSTLESFASRRSINYFTEIRCKPLCNRKSPKRKTCRKATEVLKFDRNGTPSTVVSFAKFHCALFFLFVHFNWIQDLDLLLKILLGNRHKICFHAIPLCTFWLNKEAQKHQLNL